MKEPQSVKGYIRMASDSSMRNVRIPYSLSVSPNPSDFLVSMFLLWWGGGGQRRG